MHGTNISTSFLRESNTFCRHHGRIKQSVSCWITQINRPINEAPFLSFGGSHYTLAKSLTQVAKECHETWCVSRYHSPYNFCVNFSPINPALSRLHLAFRSSNFPVTERFHSKLLLESPDLPIISLYSF